MSGIFLWLSALAVTAALAIGVSHVGMAAIDDARAGTAADAAALAGAAAGHTAAAEAAALHGAELISVSTANAVTTVVVRVGGATAQAHAERILIPIG